MKYCKNHPDRPVFSKGLCKNCWLKEHGKPLKKSPIKKKRYTIKHRSDKRKKQELVYSTSMKHRDQTNKYHYCFFCGKEIKGLVSHHHLKGRDGDLLTDNKWIVDAHNDCHVDIYHNKSVSYIIHLSWYNSFLQRLRAKDVELYEKEVFKQVKANIISMEEYNFIINSAKKRTLYGS